LLWKHMIFGSLADKDEIWLNSSVNANTLNNRDPLSVIWLRGNWTTYASIIEHVIRCY
jgi:hypothetical protein